METKVLENKLKGMGAYIMMGILIGIFIKNNASTFLTYLYYISLVIGGLALAYFLFLKDITKNIPRGKDYGL